MAARHRRWARARAELPGRAVDRDERLRTELVIQRARWVALALATGITFSLRGFTADPRWSIVAALTVTVLGVEVALRRRPSRRALVILGWVAFAGDTLAVTAALAVVSTNPADPIWATSALIAIEAASRWRARGAVLGGLLGAGLAGWWAVSAYGAEGRDLSMESLVFRGVVILVLALPTGLVLERLRREQSLARQLYELATELVVLLDDDGRILGANPTARRLLGHGGTDRTEGETDLAGRRWNEVMPGAPDLVTLLRATRDDEPVEHELPLPAGGSVWLELRAERTGGSDRVHVIGRDVTARLLAAQQARASEQRFRALFEHNADPVLNLDRDGGILHANPAAGRLLDLPVDRVLGRRLADLLSDAARTELDVPLRAALAAGERMGGTEILLGARDPRAHDVEVLPTLVDGEVSGVFVVARDVSAERARTERLRYQAEHDELTGLLNRASLRARLERCLDAEQVCGLLFLDVDGLKRINDTLGHSAGDAALVAVAQRLRGAIRDSDTAYRFAGDEFCVVVTPIDAEGLARLQGRVTASLAEPLSLGEQVVPMGAAVGCALRRPGEEPQALLARADQAMYAVKQSRGTDRGIATDRNDGTDHNDGTDPGGGPRPAAGR